ncbi:hypothetical protein N7466_000948 [Penicillium verhagenii]|uniref:uncharacterized protein n=1 Tax=Penicillium verhagenii TaxID=1562060 RepID=UPI002544D869|nr:uncharacterized protein N7466_000948 [Penicillium verhagenii]KAJ5947933.1 hypothetical protein N7466_000948 [Penicillium verhagenii]
MSITSLPLELLTHICEYLEPQDWGAFRITCRQIHDNTLEAYATRYFKTISLLLTREGLDRLEHIAACNETLRGSVEEIWIIPTLLESWTHLDKVRFPSVDTTAPLVRWGRNPPIEEPGAIQAEFEALYSVFEATLKEHRAILESGLFSALEKCLPRLENAITIGLRFYATNFLLDIVKPSGFTCLGLCELKSKFNYNLKILPMFPQRFPFIPYNLAFTQLLNAIIKSSHEIQALHTCGLSHGGHDSCGMTLKSFQLPESQYHLLLPLLKDLTTLHMCIRLKDHEQETFDEKTFKRLLNVLVTVAPTLKILTFAQWSPIEELSPLYFEDVSQRIQFSRLEELHLHSIEVTVNSLEGFLRTAAPTLKRLTLELVSLVDGIKSPEKPDPGPLTEDSRSWVFSLSAEVKNDMQGLWKRVFESWAHHLKQAQYVQLFNLGYRGRYVKLQDHLYTKRGQPNAQPSPSFNPSSFYFDAERATIPFQEWITQLQIEMWHPQLFGGRVLPGTSGINVRQLGLGISRQVPAVCIFNPPQNVRLEPEEENRRIMAELIELSKRQRQIRLEQEATR